MGFLGFGKRAAAQTETLTGGDSASSGGKLNRAGGISPEFRSGLYVGGVAVAIMATVMQLNTTLTFVLTILVSAAGALAGVRFAYRKRSKPSLLIPVGILSGTALFIVAIYARLYTSEGILYEGEIIQDFRSSLYFSAVTWTTLGYGDFIPTEATRLYAASQAMLGYIFMGVFVGIVINYLSQQSRAQEAEVGPEQISLLFVSNRVRGEEIGVHTIEEWDVTSGIHVNGKLRMEPDKLDPALHGQEEIRYESGDPKAEAAAKYLAECIAGQHGLPPACIRKVRRHVQVIKVPSFPSSFKRDIPDGRSRILWCRNIKARS